MTPTVYKVAAAVGAGSLNTFTSLSQAVAAAQAGDTIQIEPGAKLGSATVTVMQDKLTIVGDPSAGSLGLQASGTQIPSINFLGDNDRLAQLYVGSVIIGVGGTGETIADCVLNGQGVVQAPGIGFATAGNNTVSGCTFLNGANVSLGNMSGNMFNTAANDKISSNVFWNPVNFAIAVQNETAGLSITGNRVEHTDPTTGVAFIQATDCVGTISGNILHVVAAAGAIGILAQDSDVIDSGATNLSITNNVVTTNQTGIAIEHLSYVNSFAVAVTNNTLAGNLVGLALTGNGAAGGADYGTLAITGNDFRGFTGTKGSYAIAAVDNNPYLGIGPSTANIVTAKQNIFSAAKPQTVISTAGAAGTTIDTSNPLTGGQATLMAMFQTLGGGPPTAAQLATYGKAAALAQAQAAVASSQAAKAFVDGLMVSLLGRAPSAGEDQGWINSLIKPTGAVTMEQMIVVLVTSKEYYNKVTQASTNPTGAWIQAVYANLLGRQATGMEMSTWLARLPKIGLAGIAGALVASAEFRTNQVQAMYGMGSAGVSFVPNILKLQIPPAAADVRIWVNSGYDLRTLEVHFLAAPAFARGG